MAAEKCAVCKQDYTGCKCQQVCKKCLEEGVWSKEPATSCKCCKTCDLAASKCECEKTPKHDWRTGIKPPDMSTLKKKENIKSYISALRRWSKLKAVKATEQAQYIIMLANREYPELYEEIDSHFADTLDGDKEGIYKLCLWLESRFGMNVQADLTRVFSKLFNTRRDKDQDIISFITQFEQAYSDYKKFGQTLQGTSRTLFLLQNVSLNDQDHYAVQRDLDFSDKDEEKNYNKCVEALKKLHHGKVANNQARAAAGAPVKRSLDPQLTLLAQDAGILLQEDSDQEELQKEFQTFLLKKAQKSSNQLTVQKNAKIFTSTVVVHAPHTRPKTVHIPRKKTSRQPGVFLPLQEQREQLEVLREEFQQCSRTENILNKMKRLMRFTPENITSSERRAKQTNPLRSLI